MTTLEGQTPTGVLVVSHIAEVGGSTTETNAELAALAKVTTMTVKNALSSLEDAGLIVRDFRAGNHGAGDHSGRTIRIVQE